eukprot:5951752-Amphidinium_carterae.1
MSCMHLVATSQLRGVSLQLVSPCAHLSSFMMEWKLDFEPEGRLKSVRWGGLPAVPGGSTKFMSCSTL